MKLLFISLLISTGAYAKEIKTSFIGEKACAFNKIHKKEVCLRSFKEYGDVGENTLEIITRACIYTVESLNSHFCIQALIRNPELVYEPTRTQLLNYLETTKYPGSENDRNRCHIEAEIDNCLEREIQNFIRSTKVFKIPLNLPLIMRD